MDGVTNDILRILNEIQRDNKEIKTDVKQIKDDISNQFIQINKLINKVDILEAENTKLKEKLVQTHKKIIKNNIIIFGIPENEEAKLFFIDIIKVKLNVDLAENDINNIYRIGAVKGIKPRAVNLELVRNIKKQEIFQNVTKFKGTGISISNDLIEEERQQQKLLYKHYKSAKDKNYQAKLIKNKLIINGEEFTYNSLKEIGEPEEGREYFTSVVRRNNSAPASPTINFNNVSEDVDGAVDLIQTIPQIEHKNVQVAKLINQETPKISTGTIPKSISSKENQGIITRTRIRSQNL